MTALLRIQLDVVVSTLMAGALVVAFGMLGAHRPTRGVPSRAQLAWETIVGAAQRRVGEAIGARGRQVVPLAVTLFVFIVVATWLEVIPSGHPDKALPAPTGNLNLTVALAVFVVGLVHVASVRSRGWRGYFRHYLQPSPWLLPIRLVEELAKPVTLALRLFGNVFAGTVMVLLIFELIPSVIAPVPLVAWKLFSLGVAVVQAFLFALLTILYFEVATKPDDPGPDPVPALP